MKIWNIQITVKQKKYSNLSRHVQIADQIVIDEHFFSITSGDRAVFAEHIAER